MDVTIHFEVWLAQYLPFFYNLKCSQFFIAYSSLKIFWTIEVLSHQWFKKNWRDLWKYHDIYCCSPQDILGYPEISQDIQSWNISDCRKMDVFQIVEKWMWPFTLRCDDLNINHFSTIWNISDCRKMVVTIHYKVWSSQYKPFFYGCLNISVLTNWELVFQHWDLSNWILFYYLVYWVFLYAS